MDKVKYLVEYRDMDGELLHGTNFILDDLTPGTHITIDNQEYVVVERFLKNGRRSYWWSFGWVFDSFYIVVYLDEVD